MLLSHLVLSTLSVLGLTLGFRPLSRSPEIIGRREPMRAVTASEECSPSRSMFAVRGALTAEVLQVPGGLVPRGYLPGVIRLSRSSSTSNEAIDYQAIETAISFYLDGGGRISKLYAVTPEGDFTLQESVERMGFKPQPASYSGEYEIGDMLRKLGLDEGFKLYACLSEELKKFCESRLARNEGAADVLHDIVGRLLHDAGDAKEAINSYTAALLVNPNSAALFRNLGSAYHACGDMQLAFASYQQSLTVDPKDLLVYLKLAYLYEDLASKEWVEAAEHAEKCYRFYLDNVDAEDTSVLTRLGNLLMKEHDYDEAATVYLRALELNNKLHNVWFNLAHSQVYLNLEIL